MLSLQDEAIHFNVVGSGIYVPSRRVFSTEIDALANLPAGTVERSFGLASRYYANAEETSSFMAAAAAKGALADASWDADSLDAIIGACGVMEQPIPGTALLTQQKLGLGSSGIPAMDVSATCLSFLVALDVALTHFALRRWRRVLIFSADIASAALDYTTPEASAIFGDGAAAVVLESGGPHSLLAYRMESHGDYTDLCRLEAGGTRLHPRSDPDAFLAGSFFRMHGKALFRATARVFPAFMARLLDKASLAPNMLDSVIPHQASAAALEHLPLALGVSQERVVNIFGQYGNQIATSLPHALHVARRQGRLTTGSRSLLVGSAAGISLAGTVVRW